MFNERRFMHRPLAEYFLDVGLGLRLAIPHHERGIRGSQCFLVNGHDLVTQGGKLIDDIVLNAIEALHTYDPRRKIFKIGQHRGRISNNNGSAHADKFACYQAFGIEFSGFLLDRQIGDSLWHESFPARKSAWLLVRARIGIDKRSNGGLKAD